LRLVATKNSLRLNGRFIALALANTRRAQYGWHLRWQIHGMRLQRTRPEVILPSPALVVNARQVR
jgi:hypothetical protein